MDKNKRVLLLEAETAAEHELAIRGLLKETLDEVTEINEESKSFWGRLKWLLWNGGLKLWWNRLWVRKDEFHDSLDIDLRAVINMSPKKREKYMADLMRRREIAHQRDMAETDKEYQYIIDIKPTDEKPEQ